MTDSLQSRFRLPHWGWLLLATVVLIVAGIGLSIWMPYQREQQFIKRIEGWGGKVESEAVGPEWLLQIVGEDQLKRFKFLDRVIGVDLRGQEISDADLAHLTKLTNLRRLSLSFTNITDAGLAHFSTMATLRHLGLYGTTVTDKGIKELQKTVPPCQIIH